MSTVRLITSNKIANVEIKHYSVHNFVAIVITNKQGLVGVYNSDMRRYADTTATRFLSLIEALA